MQRTNLQNDLNLLIFRQIQKIPQIYGKDLIESAQWYKKYQPKPMIVVTINFSQIHDGQTLVRQLLQALRNGFRNHQELEFFLQHVDKLISQFYQGSFGNIDESKMNSLKTLIDQTFFCMKSYYEKKGEKRFKYAFFFDQYGKAQFRSFLDKKLFEYFLLKLRANFEQNTGSQMIGFIFYSGNYYQNQVVMSTCKSSNLYYSIFQLVQYNKNEKCCQTQNYTNCCGLNQFEIDSLVNLFFDVVPIQFNKDRKQQLLHHIKRRFDDYILNTTFKNQLYCTQYVIEQLRGMHLKFLDTLKMKVFKSQEELMKFFFKIIQRAEPLTKQLESTLNIDLNEAQFTNYQKNLILYALFMNDDDYAIKYEIEFVRARPLKTIFDLINYLGTLGLVTYRSSGKEGIKWTNNAIASVKPSIFKAIFGEVFEHSMTEKQKTNFLNFKNLPSILKSMNKAILSAIKFLRDKYYYISQPVIVANSVNLIRNSNFFGLNLKDWQITNEQHILLEQNELKRCDLFFRNSMQKLTIIFQFKRDKNYNFHAQVIAKELCNFKLTSTQLYDRIYRESINIKNDQNFQLLMIYYVMDPLNSTFVKAMSRLSYLKDNQVIYTDWKCYIPICKKQIHGQIQDQSLPVFGKVMRAKSTL